MTLVIWRSRIWRVVVQMFGPKRWGAWPEGYQTHIGIGIGPDEAVANMGYKLDRAEQETNAKRQRTELN